tara:strand:+ start:5607 stop:6329 length:723 start_codon:yes stop_codon:yes gene_type:complete
MLDARRLEPLCAARLWQTPAQRTLQTKALAEHSSGGALISQTDPIRRPIKGYQDMDARPDPAEPTVTDRAQHTAARHAPCPTTAPRRRSLRAGYSLMEVLIAVAIIALLAALIAPRLFGQLDASQVTAARTQIRMIETALDSYRLDIGRYPASEEGLAALAVPPPDLVDRWNGPYLDGGLPIDPWGTAYQYQAGESLSRRGIVLSYGNDGEPGGEGLAADLYSRGNDPNAGLEPSAGARP